MEYDFFLNSLPKIQKNELKGAVAHQQMLPEKRPQFSEEYSTAKSRTAGVLVLLYPKEGRMHIALIERSVYDGKHSGQIAFPGGKEELYDTSLWNTALRETEEEIGVASTEVNYIKDLTSIYVPVSHFRVYPFLAYAEKELDFVLQETEVANSVALPISHLLNPVNSVEFTVNVAEGLQINAPAFDYDNYKIWGATAMVLNEVKNLIIDSMQI